MAVLLSCQSLSKSYSARPLFKEISFGIEDTERLGLIGPNGSGKSTLLKLLAGQGLPDTGTLSVRKGLRVGYLAQDDVFPPNTTVEEVLTETLAPSGLDEFERTTQIEIMLGRVGFTQRDQKVEDLSGGWRKRLAMARELIQEPEMLLMDEPTNHLDLEGIIWLEALLKNAPFAYLVVSHDRSFLENVTNRIIELNPVYAEGFISVQGTYSDFLIEREAYQAAQVHQQQTLATQVRREIAWLQRGPQARTTKAQGRIKEAGRMIDNLAELKYRNSQNESVGIDFSASGRKTKDLIVAKGIEKSLGGRTLFSNLSFTLSPGTKLGLLGANGSGKTTLLRLCTGALEPDKGTIKPADRLRIVWFDQKREQLDKQLTLRESLCPDGDTVEYRGGSIHVSSWAKRFLFSSDQLGVPISYLSGGEQARILIANLMRQPADLLILDEPTNDLDIPSLEVLEESLSDFPGAIILVTHDRYMLDTISTEILALDGTGAARFFTGYSQWEAHQLPPAKSAAPNKTGASPVRGGPPPRSMSSSERRELSQMDAKIEAAEQEVAAIHKQMEDPAVASDHIKLQECWNKLPIAEAVVTGLYARWEELEAKAKPSG